MLYWLFFQYLAVTVLIEGLAMFLLFRRWDFVYYSFLCNLLTNPALNLVLLLAVNLLGLAAYLPTLIIAELTVFLLEAWILKLLCRFRLRQALLTSLLLNLASAIAGLLFI